LVIPAAYPHVIAVGGTDSSGAAAPFSNSGRGLDMVAPGDSVIVAAPGFLCSAGYGLVSGTSFAAPAVAGAAALLLQAHPDLDVGQLTDMLRLRGGQPAWTPETGFGLLDVPASLRAPVPAPDQPEVNDDIKWAKLQSAVLTTTRRSRTFSARLAPHTDPADVYRIKLRKRDRLHVGLRGYAGAGFRLSFGSKSLRAIRGSSFTRTIKTSGTYFVGVKLLESPDAGTTYKLSLKR
jgi:hypothetical protein